MGDLSWIDSSVEDSLQKAGLDKAADWVDKNEVRLDESNRLSQGGLRKEFAACVNDWDGEDCHIKSPEVMAEIANHVGGQRMNQEAKAAISKLNGMDHPAVEGAGGAGAGAGVQSTTFQAKPPGMGG